MLVLNLEDDYVVNKMKKTVFLDIETSLVDAKVFRTGAQFVGADQLENYTRLLTAAWGTMYDLYTDREVTYVSNHHDPVAFKKDPLDDTYVLEMLWEVLDYADVLVCHNVAFDSGWILGRFLQLGWPMPSKFSVVCTYRSLQRYNFTSKKLMFLSSQLVDTKKIITNIDLWMRCSAGDIEAFEEMVEYNCGDIYETLFLVYMRTAQYYPDRCVDLADYSLELPQCKVTGEPLDILEETYFNRLNGCEYFLYANKDLGITYCDRYNIRSAKAGKGFVRQFN